MKTTAITLGLMGGMILMLAMAMAPVQAQVSSITLDIEQDAWTDSSDPFANHGTDLTDLKAGGNGPTKHHTFMKFDVSAIPAGSTILNATLTTANIDTGSGTIELGFHLITASWSDTTINWTNEPANQTVPDYLYTFDISETGGGTFTYNITTLAQSWVDGPNHGFEMRNDSLTSRIEFRSEEDPLNRGATLDIQYKPVPTLPTAGIQGDLALAVGFFTIIMIAVIAKFGLDILGGSMTREKFIANLMIMVVVTLIFLVAWGVFLATDP